MNPLLDALFAAFLTALYFGVVGIIAIFVRFVLKIKGEVYRKMLHFFFMASIFLFLYLFKEWYYAFATIILFMTLATLGLTILERYSFYKELLAERNTKGEVKLSLFIIFTVMALGVYFFWGVQGAQYKYIIYGGFLAWGVGDGVAALVGKRDGNQIIRPEFIKTIKTTEGSLAMFIASGVIFFLVSYFYIEAPFVYIFFTSLCAASLGTVVEIISKKGWDTLTLPLLFMLLLYGTTSLALLF